MTITTKKTAIPLINGVNQFVTILGQGKTPILILHGGPGFAEGPIAPIIYEELAKDFTVYIWDQRGCGLSESGEEPLTIQLMVNDTLAIIDWILDSMKKGKIVIIGSSWGTVIGSLAAKEAPNKIAAYIGIAQVTKLQETEKLAIEWCLIQAEQTGNKEAVDELMEILNNPQSDIQKMIVQIMTSRKWINEYGGLCKIDYSTFLLSNIGKDSYSSISPEHYMELAMNSIAQLWPELLIWNSYNEVPELKMPVMMLSGVDDRIVIYDASKAYFEFVKAPVKKWVAIDNAAHLAHWSKYKITNKIINEFINNL